MSVTCSYVGQMLFIVEPVRTFQVWVLDVWVSVGNMSSIDSKTCTNFLNLEIYISILTLYMSAIYILISDAK